MSYTYDGVDDIVVVGDINEIPLPPLWTRLWRLPFCWRANYTGLKDIKLAWHFAKPLRCLGVFWAPTGMAAPPFWMDRQMRHVHYRYRG